MDSTVRYPGVALEGALAIAEAIEIRGLGRLHGQPLPDLEGKLPLLQVQPGVRTFATGAFASGYSGRAARALSSGQCADARGLGCERCSRTLCPGAHRRNPMYRMHSPRQSPNGRRPGYDRSNALDRH